MKPSEVKKGPKLAPPSVNIKAILDSMVAAHDPDGEDPDVGTEDDVFDQPEGDGAKPSTQASANGSD